MYFLALPTSFFILLRLSSNPVGYDLASDPDVATWRLNCAFTHVLFVFDSVLVYCFVSKQIICNIYKCDLKLYCQLLCSSWLFQEPWVRGGGQDGGGIGRGDHFLSYKFIERTERWTKFKKQVLISGSGHQAPRKAAHCLRREVGQNIKRETKELGTETLPGKGALIEEVSNHQETLALAGLREVFKSRRAT